MPERARNKSARQEREKAKESQKFHPIFPQNEVFRRVKKRRTRECQKGKKRAKQEREKAKESLKYHPNFPQTEVFRRVRKRMARECQKGRKSAR